jgi:hypothetical protein
MRAMRRRSALLLAFVLATVVDSCVPAGEELAPKGAAGLVTEPSPAARGEPFVTDDGWNVRIDKLALLARVSASGTDDDDDDPKYMWNGAARVELLVRAVPVGPSSIAVALQGAGRRFRGSGIEVPTYQNLGVEPSLEARFRLPEDVIRTGVPGAGPVPGPSVVIVARGEKGGVVVVLDIALSSHPPSASAPNASAPNMAKPNVDVRANDVTFTYLGVAAERLLAVDPSTGRGAAFQPIADADARGDGDGHVTEAELRAVACSECPDPSAEGGHTLLDRITILAGQMLSIR